MAGDERGEHEPSVYWLVVGLLIVSAVTPWAMAAAGEFDVTAGATATTDSGFTATYGQSYDITSGPNVMTGTDSMNLNGVVELQASGGSATVETLQSGSRTWTNLSAVAMPGSGGIRVNPIDTNPTTISGSVDAYRLANIQLSNASNTPDMAVTAGGTWALTINNTGLAQDKGVVVYNADTGEPLGSGSVTAAGDVSLDNLDSVDGPVNVKVGPPQLVLLQETAPTTKADDITVRLRFFEQGQEQVVERTISDGDLPLGGIPLDQRVTITAQPPADSDYIYRRAVFDSFASQAEMYLLNTSEADVAVANVQFTLQDLSGNYPGEQTTLFIKKPITKDFDGDGTDETRYQTISGDVFGASNSFTARLLEEERYRLVIENQDGSRRILGSYVATDGDRAPLTVQQVTIEGEPTGGTSTGFEYFEQDTDDDGTPEQFVRVKYRDPLDRTERFDYAVVRGDGTTA